MSMMCSNSFSPIDRCKREESLVEEEGPKRTCSEANNEGFRPSLPDLVVRQLTFGPASCNGINTQLPQKAVQEIQEEAYRWVLLKGMMSRNSDAYKNQALTIYHSPLDFKQQEEKEEELGNVSYYYPTPCRESPSGEVQCPEDNSMEEESDASYQTQLRETGMQGVPMPDVDDPSWIL